MIKKKKLGICNIRYLSFSELWKNNFGQTLCNMCAFAYCLPRTMYITQGKPLVSSAES